MALKALTKTLPCLLVAGLLAAAGCDRSSTPPAPTAKPPAASAPEKSLPRIDLEGFHRLIAEAGRDKQILVIDFWATWCEPCVALFPELHDAMAKLGPRVRLATVTVDSPGKYEAAAVDFLEKHQATKDSYLLAPNADERTDIVKHLANQWQDQAVPAILVFADGKLAGEYINADTHADIIAAGVKKLLNAPPATRP